MPVCKCYRHGGACMLVPVPVQDLIDWAGADRKIRQIADPETVYLIGHSRGGKVATLAAAADPRVAALCLLDPVDNTVYAPLGPGYPSAAATLAGLPAERALPVAVVGVVRRPRSTQHDGHA